MSVAIVHDYLTQRGGAERVVLSMLAAFPEATVYTSLYHPAGTFPEFRSARIRTLAIDKIGALRRQHRLALPLLAPAFSRLCVEEDVALCSSSGWAHGASVAGRKVVYCHSPARWLYQADSYLGRVGRPAGVALAVLGPYLRRWDKRAARSADRYLTNSSAVRERIRSIYGLDADVLPPPPRLDPRGPRRAVETLEPGYFLCVSRLLPYKNVSSVIAAFRGLPEDRLVVVGSGPDARRLESAAASNVRLLGSVSDEELRWLYSGSRGLVAASYEDYGLTPLEAASFGKPSAVLRGGGFLDTVVEGDTGVFFDAPDPALVRAAVRRLGSRDWSATTLQEHARRYGEEAFVDRLREIVEETHP